MRSNKKIIEEESPQKNKKSISSKFRKHKHKTNKSISNIYYRCKDLKKSIIKIDQFTDTQLQFLNIDYEKNKKIENLIELKNMVKIRKFIL